MPTRHPSRTAILVLAGAALALACAARREKTPWTPAADADSVRQTRSGTVVGSAGRYGGHAWLGIPFAKPPVGERRWRAPEPPAPWTGTREALAFASPCPQLATRIGGLNDTSPGQPTGSEDCLALNVWAPAYPAGQVPTGSARLPVMLWIHGGGNSVGHGGFNDASRLATAENLVVITINYRLGPFGWFRHEALRADAASDADRSGNFGTLDQIRALEWVRDNVEAFGGDPGNVTIFGESAGGHDVFMLLVSPPARGLFHRAIAQSGGTDATPVEKAEHLHDDPVPGHARSSGEIVLELLVRDRTATNREAAKAALARMSPADVARYLRGKSSVDMLEASSGGNFDGLLDLPMVFSDGAVLPLEKPGDLLGRPGRYHAVPVMLGTTRDETKLFQLMDPAQVRRWLWLVPVARDPERYDLAAEYGSKLWKASAADEPAMRMRPAQGPSVFVYRFDWDEEPTILGSDLGRLLGAAHALEIPFIFGHFDLGRDADVIWTAANEPGRQTLSAAMMSYWAAFAYSGDPGTGRRGELPRWGAWDATTETSPKFVVLDTPAGGGIRMASDYVTKERVVAQIEADPRLATPAAKCERLRDLALYSNRFTRDEYALACAKYPLDGYPWGG